jgi:hypothetical protein
LKYNAVIGGVEWSQDVRNDIGLFGARTRPGVLELVRPGSPIGGFLQEQSEQWIRLRVGHESDRVGGGGIKSRADHGEPVAIGEASGIPARVRLNPVSEWALEGVSNPNTEEITQQLR